MTIGGSITHFPIAEERSSHRKDDFMQAGHLSKVQRTRDGVQERNGQVLISIQFREMGHSSDRSATRKRGDGRLARPAGPLHHPEGAKGRNFRQRRKPEEGSPVREPSSKEEQCKPV